MCMAYDFYPGQKYLMGQHSRHNQIQILCIYIVTDDLLTDHHARAILFSAAVLHEVYRRMYFDPIKAGVCVTTHQGSWVFQS